MATGAVVRFQIVNVKALENAKDEAQRLQIRDNKSNFSTCW